jgi:hypothetical protein
MATTLVRLRDNVLVEAAVAPDPTAARVGRRRRKGGGCT